MERRASNFRGALSPFPLSQDRIRVVVRLLDALTLIREKTVLESSVSIDYKKKSWPEIVSEPAQRIFISTST
jgi:hypothetical protein